MTTALTETTWLKTLDRLANDTSTDDTTRTLAKMLWEIIYACSNRDELAQILDTYGARMLERQP